VDDNKQLFETLHLIDRAVQQTKVIFPVHPRTRNQLKSSHQTFKNIIFIEPLGYHEFMYCIKNAQGVITDSGGIQEETTFLNVPCITYRTSTERPETVEMGTNLLADTAEKLAQYIELLEEKKWRKGNIPPLWDGATAERIFKILTQLNTSPL
jgi:UDP-N-acetylglucosamine 2-epimerase (non-hydrolysing)